MKDNLPRPRSSHSMSWAHTETLEWIRLKTAGKINNGRRFYRTEKWLERRQRASLKFPILTQKPRDVHFVLKDEAM